ncbi:MAG: YtxH domain-containing protein [Acidobacteria bacterium]|nr:MAG: YtxH domain-containing protein [Acidobacteriota bacterium]
MSDEQGSAGKILTAFLVGAAAGAAVALLFAPATGKETREFITEKAREGREKAAEAARQTREALARQRETITSAIERGREAYREARDKETA